MKTIFLSGLLITSLVAIERPTKPVEILSSFIITPLYTNEETRMVVNIPSDPSRTSLDVRVNVTLVNDLYPDGVTILNEQINRCGEIGFTYNNKYTRPENELRLTYGNLTVGNTTSSIFLKPVKGSKVETIDHNGQITSDNLVYIYKKSTGWISTKITSTFTGFDDYYVPDYFHKINLNDFKITTSIDCPSILGMEPSLLISNVDGIFNDVSNEDELVSFKLKPKISENFCTFSLENPLFVDKETLLMSSTYKEGYVKTNYIFFPRNQMKKQEDFEAYFQLRKFGPDMDTIIHPFKLRALKNTIGDCRNSEYCVLKTKIW